MGKSSHAGLFTIRPILRMIMMIMIKIIIMVVIIVIMIKIMMMLIIMLLIIILPQPGLHRPQRCQTHLGTERLQLLENVNHFKF